MANAEPLSITLDRNQRMGGLFPDVTQRQPQDILSSDVAGASAGQAPSTFSQTALALANYGVQQQQPDLPGIPGASPTMPQTGNEPFPEVAGPYNPLTELMSVYDPASQPPAPTMPFNTAAPYKWQGFNGAASPQPAMEIGPPPTGTGPVGPIGPVAPPDTGGFDLGSFLGGIGSGLRRDVSNIFPNGWNGPANPAPEQNAQLQQAGAEAGITPSGAMDIQRLPMGAAGLGGGGVVPLLAGLAGSIAAPAAVNYGLEQAQNLPDTGIGGMVKTAAENPYVRGAALVGAGVAGGIAGGVGAARFERPSSWANAAKQAMDEAATTRAQIEQQQREMQYGGQAAGQVTRTPGGAYETALRPPEYGQNAAEVVAGNRAALERAQGSTVPVSPTAPYYDPKSVLLQRIADAKPLQEQNKELLGQFRSRQAGAFSAVTQSDTGEAGFNRALGAMRGQAERVSFQPLRDAIAPEQVDSLFTAVTQSHLQPFEQANAGQALRGILDGQVPTPSSLANLERVFPGVTESLRRANILPKEPLWNRALAIASDIANVPRALMTSGDLSASLRQAGMAAPSHPSTWWQAMQDQVAGYRSLEGAQAAMDRIEAHPLRPFLDDMNIHLLPIDGSAPFDQREEAFMSGLANKVPLVERSQRAYTTAMNSMRAGVAYDILGNMSPEQLAAMSDQRLQRLGSFVNAITGRGDIPAALERYQPELNALFFSPRNTFGKVQANLSVLSRDPLVRQEAAKSLIAFYGTGAGILAAAHLAGFKVGLVPGNADFGKIVLPGGTRLDIWGGNAQLFRLVANLATGQSVGANGQTYPQGRLDTVGRFLRNKLAPIPGEVAKAVTGTNNIGQPWNAKELPGDAIRLVTPLFLQDMYDAVRQSGPVEGAVAGVGSALGIGAQAQTPTPATQVAQGNYAQLKPEDQPKGMIQQGWQMLKSTQGAPPELGQYQSYYDWHDAQVKALTPEASAALKPAGHSDKEIAAAVEKKIAADPVTKAWTNARTYLKDQWVMQNPQLALNLYAKNPKYGQPGYVAGYDLTQEQLAGAHALVAQKQSPPLNANPQPPIPALAEGGVVKDGEVTPLKIEDAPKRRVRKVTLRDASGKVTRTATIEEDVA